MRLNWLSVYGRNKRHRIHAGKHLELRHLPYFLAVAENLNFTKATAKLHLAQHSLTRQIHNLEEETDVPLLNRSKRQVAFDRRRVGFPP